MKRYKIYSTCILFFMLFAYPILGQNKADSAYRASLISRIGDIPAVTPGAKKVILPAAPQGFALKIAGSDNQQVIDSDGNIYTPLTTTTATLYLQLTGGDLEQPLDIENKQVNVPGKHQDEGINPKPEVIPTLREWYGYDGQFEFRKGASIVVNPADKAILQKAAEILQNDLLLFTGIKPTVKYGKPKAGDIYLVLQGNPELGGEGYYLDIDRYVSINASKYKGLFWGTHTLLQMLEQDGKHAFLPKGIARDYPKYEVRGFMLDVGRKFSAWIFCAIM